MSNASKLKSVFKKANEGADSLGDFDDLPPGEYHMKLVESGVGETKAKAPMATQKFEVLAPEEHKGRFHWENSVLDSEKSVKFLFARLRSLGYDTNGVEDENDVKEICDDCNNEQYEVLAKIVQKGSGENAKRFFNITEVLGEEETPEDETAPEEVPAEETKEEAPAEDAVPDSPEEAPEEVPAEALDLDDDDEEGEALEVGMFVKFSFKGKRLGGNIEQLNESDQTVAIKTVPKGNLRVVPVAQILEIVKKSA